MQSWYLAGTAQDCAMCDASGNVLFSGDLQSLVITIEAPRDRARIHVCDKSLMLASLDCFDADTAPTQPIVKGKVTESTQGLLASQLTVHSYHTNGLHYLDGTAIMPDTLAEYCIGIKTKLPLDSVRRVKLWAKIHKEQTAILQDCAGIEPKQTLASTAAAVAIPKDWRKGAAWFMQNRPQLYNAVKQANFGGRQQTFAPGRYDCAEYYDINSAYAWALTQPIPDWQIYTGRKPCSREPSWLDCDVITSGKVGPLPVRNQDGSLSYPIGKMRGIWTAVDLDKSNVKITKIHASYYSRYSDDLRPCVSNWADRRAACTEYAARATFRALSNSLWGRLGLRPLQWRLWHLREGEGPPQAIPLGPNSPWLAFASKPDYNTFVCPGAASWVTALIREKVWPYIADGKALHTHTDSLHVLANTIAPPLGTEPGQWSLKHKGPATYNPNGSYRIGSLQTVTFR